MKRFVALLGSLAIAFPAMVLLAAGIVASYSLDAAPRWWLLAPLAVLSVNLLAAIATHPRLRRRLPLLAFHLCLLAALALSLAALLTKLEGRVEVLAGQAFDPGAVTVTERGPWHPRGALARVRFTQRSFQVDYAPGLVRGETRSLVDLAHADGGWSRREVGDTRALGQAGFRFYTTSNKGLAAVLGWHGDDGAVAHGAVHFPSFPLNDWKQLNEWTAPSCAGKT